MALKGFKLNHGGIQSYLDGGGGVEALLEAKAQEVLARAQASAPYDAARTSGEHYRDSLHIETDHTDRMVKRVVADAPHAMVVEANTGNLARSL